MSIYKNPEAKKLQLQLYESKPGYVIVAEDDIFFPGIQSVKTCQMIFRNFKDFHILKDSKHIPDPKSYPKIESKLQNWLEAK